MDQNRKSLFTFLKSQINNKHRKAVDVPPATKEFPVDSTTRRVGILAVAVHHHTTLHFVRV